MPLILHDRVKETSSTKGTGALTLQGTQAGFVSFLEAIGEGNATYYAIEEIDSHGMPSGQWEVGQGTVSAATLSRDSVFASSNANMHINITANSQVFCTFPAAKIVTPDSTTEFSNKSGDISQWANDIGYITDYTVTQTDVTQHEAALVISQSQISDLDHYTTSDFNEDFAAKTTTDLSEGANLYYTTARVNADAPNVTLSGALDYLTLAGQAITLHAIDLHSDVTGTLPIANGGTGQTAKTDAFDALSPATTKGDIIVSDGNDNVREAVGNDWETIVANSSKTHGIEYVRQVFHPGQATGRYYWPVNASPVIGTVAVIANILYANMHYTGQRITLDKASMEVTTAATGITNLCRIGIYDDDGAGRPNNLLKDCGTVDISTVGVKEITGLGQTIEPGFFHMCIIPSDPVTIRGTGTTAVGAEAAFLYGTEQFASVAPSLLKIQPYVVGLPDPMGAMIEGTSNMVAMINYRL